MVRFGILVRSLWTRAIFLKIKRFKLVHGITLVCDTTTTPWAIYGNRMYRWVHYTIFMSIGVPYDFQYIANLHLQNGGFSQPWCLELQNRPHTPSCHTQPLLALYKPIENGLNRPSYAIIPTIHIVWRCIVEPLIGGEKSPLLKRIFSAVSCSSWLLILTKALLCAMSPQNGLNHPSCGAHPRIPMA